MRMEIAWFWKKTWIGKHQPTVYACAPLCTLGHPSFLSFPTSFLANSLTSIEMFADFSRAWFLQKRQGAVADQKGKGAESGSRFL